MFAIIDASLFKVTANALPHESCSSALDGQSGPDEQGCEESHVQKGGIENRYHHIFKTHMASYAVDLCTMGS
jgi:hypothetical protein